MHVAWQTRLVRVARDDNCAPVPDAREQSLELFRPAQRVRRRDLFAALVNTRDTQHCSIKAEQCSRNLVQTPLDWDCRSELHARAVLHLVCDDPAPLERAPAHKLEGHNFDEPAVKEGIDALGCLRGPKTDIRRPQRDEGT